MLTIRYCNRAEHKSIEIEIRADVVAVKIPPQEGQPALEVNVNTDAVLVDRTGPRRLGMLDLQRPVDGSRSRRNPRVTPAPFEEHHARNQSACQIGS